MMNCCYNCVCADKLVLPRCTDPDLDYILDIGTVLDPQSTTDYVVYFQNLSNGVVVQQLVTIDLLDNILSVDLSEIIEFLNAKDKFRVFARKEMSNFLDWIDIGYGGTESTKCIEIQFVLTNDGSESPTSILNQKITVSC